MASSTINQEIEWLKLHIIPKLIEKSQSLNNNNNNESELKDFKILDVQLQLIGTQEAFMLTSCYRAQIKYDYQGEVKNKNIFVKRTPEIPQEIFDGINFKALFSNEILAYETIVPELENFAALQLNTAKFYYGDLKSNSGLVVTEDFCKNQWTVTKDKYNLSLKHALLAVEYLAKFHAIGFALRDLNANKFQSLTNGILESRYGSVLHPQWAISLRVCVKRAYDACRKYEPEVDEDFLKKLQTLIGDNYAFGKELVMNPKEPLVTLCHGDYLRNNIAFKYNDQMEPIDVMMFDLQTIRVSSPMVDLTVFLALSTFAEVRSGNFEQIFSTYCAALKQNYEKIAQKEMPEYLSESSLISEYIRFLPYSLGVCASFLLSLVQPQEMTTQEMLMAQPTEEELIADTMTRGGEVVDRELAAQVKELYQLCKKHNVQIFKGQQ